jgi:hypothetical protein
MVEKIDHGLCLLSQHYLAHHDHVGAPMRFSSIGVSCFDELHHSLL